ncbi:hypothetical protein Q8A67_003851 [Cirrhinus molitorella]|uniref:Uncharacterized protein n=1 Tax=Cirrhinus molitorella TaxID=172907 RepID=A0AA88U4X8_9TELE|nr:hypothetical protein Q8A67_003851 [Cirrhinus molitorella]
MAFPVDILTNVDDEALELAAEEYMSQLPYRNTEYLSLSDSKQIEIGLFNVSYVPLYGTDTTKKLLALFSPEDSNTVVGLYLLDQWWRVEDVLKTAEPSRTGLVKVSTLGERIVLYALNRIVLRNEKSSGEVFFLCHCEDEAAKILWKDGEAIGFYSFKPKGSLCRNFVTHCYHLPVMDTIFVRKCHRGQGHGVKILEDFVGSFRNEYIGLKFPLSEAMYKVCEKYFSIYPADKEFLWEVQNIGSPFQRTLIANRLEKLKLKEKDQVVSKLNFEEDASASMEIEITKVQDTTEYTEIVEETITDITKEVDDIPVTRRGKGSNLKRRGIRDNSEERLSENKIRVEDIEAGVESSTEVAAVENLNAFSVKESETVLRSSVDTVTATVTNFAELRESQREDEQGIEKDIVTATSEGTPFTHLTTAGEIKSQRGGKEECEMVIKEYTVGIQGSTIGSIDQSHIQSVVDVEIVKISTGPEEGKNKEVEKDEPVCEAEKREIKQMLDEAKKEKTAETEVAEQSETHVKSTEKELTYSDVEITENIERAEDEVMAQSRKDLIEDNSNDSIGQEKTEAKDEDTVLQQSLEVKDQTVMEADSVTEVISTEKVLCAQQKLNEAEIVLSETNQTMTNKDTLIEKASKNKLGSDEAEQVYTKSKLPQKRTSALTPSRMSKRLRHQPAEKDFKTTKSVKRVQQRSKHHSKAVMLDENTEQSTDETEHDVSEVMEKIQEAQVENKAEAESEVDDYKEKEMLTVETVSTMDIEITQIKETVDVVPEVSEFNDQEGAPQQSSVEPPEVQESKTTPQDDDETVENSTVMLTLSEAKGVLVDLHKHSPNDAGDNYGEISTPEQEGMKDTMPSEQQAAEETMRIEEQDETLETKPIEEPAFTTTTEEYDVAADANRTLEQSTAYKRQEGEPEPKTMEVEKADTEQANKDEQDSDKSFPEQNKQTQKKGSDTPSRSTRDQPVDPGVTVRSLRSTLKQIKISPVRRSTRSKAVIPQVESVKPQLRTDENPERDEVFSEGVGPEENKFANTNVDETPNPECGSSELLKAAEIDDKGKEPSISSNENEKTSATTEETVNVCIPVITTEASLESLDEMASTNIEETAIPESSDLLMVVEIDDQEKEIQTVDGSEEKVSLAEPDKEVEKDGGTPVIQLQRATVLLVDLNKLSQNTETEGDTSEDLTHSQMEEKLELDGPDKNEQELTNLESEDEEQQELQTEEDTEKCPEEEKKQEENTAEEQSKLDKQNMTFEEQKPTKDLDTMPDEGVLVESNEIENSQNGDEGVSSLAQENLKEEAPVSTQRSLRQRTIKVQSPPKRKSRRTQKQDAEVFVDKTEIDLITEIDDNEKAHQTSTVDATEKVIPLVEAEPEDGVAETGVEEINKMENKETNSAETKDTGEEASEVAEQANLEQQHNEPLVKNDKETAETEKTMEIDPVVGKEQTYIQKEEKVSQVSLIEAEPDEEVEKDDGTQVIQLQNVTVVLVDLNKLSQNTERESTELLTHSQTEEKLELDTPDNSEYQLCNLASEEEEQQEQLQKEEDTEKTVVEEKMEIENTVEQQIEPNVEDITFEGQKPTDLEEQNNLQVTEIVEVYRAVIDVDVEEAVKSGEHPKKTTSDKANIILEAKKEKQTISVLEMSSVAQVAPEAVEEILEEEASVSTERSLRHRTIKIQSPPKRKSRRVYKQEAKAFEDKTGNVQITGNGVEEMHREGSKIDDKEETLPKSTVETTEVISLLEADYEKDVIKKGFEDIMIENTKTNLAVTKDTDEEAPELGEETNLEQQENEQLVKNKETVETEKPMEIDPLVSREQTTIQTDEKISQVESTETNESNNERTTRRSLRLSAKSVTPTQKTRKSPHLHKVELEPVKETNKRRNEHEETSTTTEETVIMCMPIIIVESNLESLDEMANTNAEETTPEPETSELLMGIEMNDKKEASQTVEEFPPIEADPDEEVEKDDGTPVILQEDTLVLVDLNKLDQNTEETDTSDILTQEQLELCEPDKSEYELRNLTSEEEEQDMTVEGQKPIDDLVGQNDVNMREIVEEHKKDIVEDVEESGKSGEHPKATTKDDQTNIIQETENDQDISLKEKQMDNDIEMSSLVQEGPEAVEEILEEEASERSLRRRTIKIQSTPIRKSRRVQKLEAEAFKGKTETVPLTGKGDKVNKEGAEIDKEEKLQNTTVEATENIVLLIEGEPDKDVIEKEFEEIDNMDNKETNLGNEAASEMEREVNLEQQENEPFVENETETAEIEKPIEMDEVSILNKEQTNILEETTIQVEEEISQMESYEINENKNESTTRRSLRISEQSGTPTQKTRKSTRLHKVELEPVKETNKRRNEHEGTSTTTEETVIAGMPIITVESNLESSDEMPNTNAEEPTLEPETAELLMGIEINDKKEASQIVEEVPSTEADPDEKVEKDDGTPVILQEDTLVLVDLNKRDQNTEETDTPEVLPQEQLELCEPDKSEDELRNLTSEEEEQDMTVEGQKPIDDLVGQNDVNMRETVEEHKKDIVEDVEESGKSGEHPKATTKEDQTNIIQEIENDQDISLKEKQMDNDIEMSSLVQEGPEAVEEILEEKASERSLRRRTIKIQSTPIRKSRKLEAEVFKGKTETVPLTGKGDEVNKEGAEIELQKTTVEATENIVLLIEGEPDKDVIEKEFKEIDNMDNKETNLGNEAASEMEREVNLEQQENEPFVENETETAEIEKPIEMDEVSVVNKEQTNILEETTIQVEEEISQIESYEINENKNDKTTGRRSPRISEHSGTSTQKTRKSARLHKVELESVEEAEMSRNEKTSSMTAKTVNVPVIIETNVENLDEDGGMVSMTKKVETTSDEQEIDISNDKGKVDEALPKISTGEEEDETVNSIKKTENETDKTQKDVEEAVQESQAEPSQENTDQEQEKAAPLDENVGETNQTNEFKTKAVEKVALENSKQEAAFITRSLRYRTVTVQSTPRRKSKRLHRQELVSERKTDELNVSIGKENETLTAEEGIAVFEHLETKEGKAIIQTNTDEKSEKSGRNDDTEKEGNEILFEIMENNSGIQVNTENKTQEENLEREDVEVPNEQEEDEVSNVQEKAKPLQESENEGDAENTQGSSADVEETAVERRTLRKRMTVETSAPRKSKRLRKQEHDDDSEQVKEAITGQTESAEVTFTADSVELRSDVTAAAFEGSILGEEILQKIQTNAEGTKSDGDCTIHKGTETDAVETQEVQKQSILNETQRAKEEVVEQHVDLESSTNEGFTLALEVEETDQEENKAGEEEVMEAPKEIFTSAEKSEEGGENISDGDEKSLAIDKHVFQSSSTTGSTRRKSMRLLMHESKKKTKEDKSDSEPEAQQTEKQSHQRKRKAITDSTPAHRAKHVRDRIA